MSKNLDPLSSLRDAPTLTASSLQGAPPLGASGSNLVGKRGSQVNKTNLRLDAGSSEYEDEFDRCGLVHFFDSMNFKDSVKLKITVRPQWPFGVLMYVHNAHYCSEGGGTISEHIETPSDGKVLSYYVILNYI